MINILIKTLFLLLPVIFVLSLLAINPNPACATYNWCDYLPEPSQEPEPTQTPQPSVEPSETPVPSEEPEQTPSPTESPSEQPRAEVPSQQLSPPSTPQGPACVEIKYAPTVTAFKRLDADSVWITWSPVDEFVRDYIVQYGLGPVPMWNTKIEGKRETDLNLLPQGLHVWVRVAGTHNGCVGKFGEWVDP